MLLSVILLKETRAMTVFPRTLARSRTGIPRIREPCIGGSIISDRTDEEVTSSRKTEFKLQNNELVI